MAPQAHPPEKGVLIFVISYFCSQKTARCGSAPVIFVMMPPPKAACLVASLGRAVQPLVHAPEAVEPTRIGRIGVVNGAVLVRECAHARSFAHVGGRIGS